MLKITEINLKGKSMNILLKNGFQDDVPQKKKTI